MLDDRSGHVIRSRHDGIKAKRTNNLRKVLLWSKEPWAEVDDLGHDSMNRPAGLVSDRYEARALPVQGDASLGVCIP